MKPIKIALIVVGLVTASKFVRRAYRVAHDPNVIAAWKDASHDLQIVFNRAYRKNYTNQVEQFIEEIQKED